MDKLAKVRDEIEKLKSQLLRGACSSQIAMETRCKEEAYNEVLAILDSLQEEPVSNPTPNEKMSVERWKIACEAACCDINYRSHYGFTETRDDYFVDGVQWADEHPKEEPVSEDLEEASKEWLKPQLDKSYADYGETKMMELTHFDGYAMLDAIEFGAKWQKEHLWKPADGDDLPEIDREVIALTQPYPNDEHLKVVFAHRPNNKYAKVWNSDLGEEQVIELEWFGKGEWNIPFVKYWLDAKLPYEENKISKEIEL